MLQAIEDNGIARDTIVIFTSDNGGEHFADTWPFSGKKQDFWKAASVSPGRVLAGRVSEQVTANMDWLPALLAAVGTTPDPAYPSGGMNFGPI